MEAGEEKENEQSSSVFSDGSEEYADNDLFANYDDDEEDVESLSESLMDARLVNNYKPEILNGTVAPESDPEAMPLQREADSNNPEMGTMNRQMDIPLTEVSADFMRIYGLSKSVCRRI